MIYTISSRIFTIGLSGVTSVATVKACLTGNMAMARLLLEARADTDKQLGSKCSGDGWIAGRVV